jgi:DNA-binding NarL/FixJ family response regulator
MQKMRILIACRQLDYCSALELYLQNKSDHEVVEMATDTPTMLTLAQATQPDIILLDWHLSDQPLAALNQVKQQNDIQPGVILINVPDEAGQKALATEADDLVLMCAPAKNILIAIETIRVKRWEG